MCVRGGIVGSLSCNVPLSVLPSFERERERERESKRERERERERERGGEGWLLYFNCVLAVV